MSTCSSLYQISRFYRRVYHHGGNWFEGEHKAIVDRAIFDRVQQLLATKANGRKVKRSESGALLTGKLYDDRGNRMSPSFSSKNGVRYRFYVSSAMLRGRKTEVGSVGRLPAAEIECAVLTALEANRKSGMPNDRRDPMRRVERIVVAHNHLEIRIAVDTADSDGSAQTIRSSWSANARDTTAVLEESDGPEGPRNENLIQSVVRAHAWVRCLRNGTYESVEALAEASRLHPKVVRQALRLAFLSPDVTSAILEFRQPASLSLAQIPKLFPLQWIEHRRLLGYGYSDAYGYYDDEDDGGCYLVRRRVITRYGWRIRRVQVCG